MVQPRHLLVQIIERIRHGLHPGVMLGVFVHHVTRCQHLGREAQRRHRQLQIATEVGKRLDLVRAGLVTENPVALIHALEQLAVQLLGRVLAGAQRAAPRHHAEPHPRLLAGAVRPRPVAQAHPQRLRQRLLRPAALPVPARVVQGREVLVHIVQDLRHAGMRALVRQRVLGARAQVVPHPVGLAHPGVEPQLVLGRLVLRSHQRRGHRRDIARDPGRRHAPVARRAPVRVGEHVHALARHRLRIGRLHPVQLSLRVASRQRKPHPPFARRRVARERHDQRQRQHLPARRHLTITADMVQPRHLLVQIIERCLDRQHVVVVLGIIDHLVGITQPGVEPDRVTRLCLTTLDQGGGHQRHDPVMVGVHRHPPATRHAVAIGLDIARRPARHPGRADRVGCVQGPGRAIWQ